jgi:hypothetical protein
MPATGYAVLLLAASAVLGIAALARRSRRLGVLAAMAFSVFLRYTGLLVLGVLGM